MKAKDIYSAACAFLYEQPGEDAEGEKYYPGFLNLLLQEALPYENAVRRSEGGVQLAEAPIVSDGETEIPYCDALTRIALPYGLAAWFFQDIADNFQAENYRGKYLLALKDARKHAFVPVEDVYGDAHG